MANVSYWSGSWVGGELAPGQPHYWNFVGFNYGDVVDVSAHPIAGDPNAGQRILEVEDLRFEADVSGRRMYFTVRNVGASSVPGYAMGFAIVFS